MIIFAVTQCSLFVIDCQCLWLKCFAAPICRSEAIVKRLSRMHYDELSSSIALYLCHGLECDRHHGPPALCAANVPLIIIDNKLTTRCRIIIDNKLTTRCRANIEQVILADRRADRLKASVGSHCRQPSAAIGCLTQLRLVTVIHPRWNQKEKAKRINAMHLEPGRSRKEEPIWNLKDIAKKAKTDWHRKEKLLKEFQDDILKLKKPTRRVILPPPGTSYEEAIHHIMFHQMEDRRKQKGWSTLHDLAPQGHTQCMMEHQHLDDESARSSALLLKV
jgi:hypothetical protein